MSFLQDKGHYANAQATINYRFKSLKFLRQIQMGLNPRASFANPNGQDSELMANHPSSLWTNTQSDPQYPAVLESFFIPMMMKLIKCSNTRNVQVSQKKLQLPKKN